MPKKDPRAGYLPDLVLQRLGGPEPAGLLLASVPVPPGASRAWTLDRRPTVVKPLGQWPGPVNGAPRRLLLVADGGPAAPGSLRLRPGQGPSLRTPVPEVSMDLFRRSPDPLFIWEQHLLTIRWGGRSVSLALGLRRSNGLRWWECCRLVHLAESPGCLEIEMGGAIPLETCTSEVLHKYPGYKNPALHNHRWLNGHLYARLYANGVCELFARHVNARFFDEGKALENAVPVVGIRVEGRPPRVRSLCGPWDGSRSTLDLEGIRFDLSEPAFLATPAQPGSLALAETMLVWQPYEGMELYGGVCPKDRTGDPFIVHSRNRLIPRGMGRTLRFSFSLAPDRSPRIARYLPPAWWYGACEEFSAAPLLPVSAEPFEPKLEACRTWIRTYSVPRGFEAASIPRHAGGATGQRFEPGWEGEAPWAALLLAWQSGRAEDYALALRACWTFTDLYIDHAAKMVRMHGYPPPAFALPMNRVHACVGAWLETGDAFPLREAQAVLDASHATHKNSWPRAAIGRDACYLRGAVLLYRYTGDHHYLDMARDATRDVADSQRPDGSFGDQGGGSGIHGWSAFITKPWMACMAVGGLLDLLEIEPDEPRALATVRRFADWLMANRIRCQDGKRGWAYQHNYDGRSRFLRIGTTGTVRLPGRGRWHHDYLARILPFLSLRSGHRAYYAAFMESFCATEPACGGDHGLAQIGQYLPWLTARLWNARLTARGLRLDPVYLGPRTPRSAVIDTPWGRLAVGWDARGRSWARGRTRS